MREPWDRRALVQLAVTVAALAAVLAAFSRFARWVERRPGAVLSDPLLALLPPRDLTWLTFTLVYGGLLAAVLALARRPQRFCLGLQGYAAMVLLRMAAMWAVPLDPPPGMIPLEDPFVRFLGPTQVLTRDLFFSGHAASLFLFSLAVPGRGLRALVLAGTLGVAASVLAQHVHYSIDVLAAPPFALAAWRAARLLRDRLGLPAA